MDALDPVTRLILRAAFSIIGTGCIIGGLGALFGTPVAVIALGIIFVIGSATDRRDELRGD